MSGVTLALIAAAIFGFQNAAARRGVITATPLHGMIITVPTVVPLLALISYCLGGLAAMQTWSYQTYMLAGAAGVMHFVIGRFSNYNSMQALGSTLSTPIQQLSTVASLFCAVIILGESLTGMNIFGIALVSIGPALLIAGRRRYASSEVDTTFVPDLKRGILHGMVCVVGYGGSPILIVLALQSAGGLASGEKLVETYLAGGAFAHSSAILLFSYIFASACVIIMGLNSNGFNSLSSMSREGLRWFLLSGFMIAVSQVFRYAALALAPVSVVVPIQRLSVIFRLLFNWYLNRQYERIETRIVIGIILSVFGAAALGVDTTVALKWLDLNPVIYSILNWRL
jgi:drug/metabolite transporter (DMT)-like permease